MARRRRKTLLVVSLVGLWLAACSGMGEGRSAGVFTGKQASATGLLRGRVTRSPLVPVERSDHPAPTGPVAGARMVVADMVGSQVASVISDERGEYRVELPPGNYRVDLERVGGFGATKDLPATIAIRAGQERRLDVRVDSGIR